MFYSDASLTAGVKLAAGSGSWSALSDRNVKENFATVNGEEILARLAAMPITNWNYVSQDASIRHIGPMAQDFYSAFGVGEDDRRISAVDANGIAFAAIRELHKIIGEQASVISSLVTKATPWSQPLCVNCLAKLARTNPSFFPLADSVRRWRGGASD